MKLFKKSSNDSTPVKQIISVTEERKMLGEQLGFAASEAYKLLRTNLVFSLPNDKKCRIVGVTSSLRGEGKSTTTINLGYSLAEDNKKVLIIEADMRLPTISNRLSLKKAKGLSNLLVGMSNGRDIMQESGLHPNLMVIAAGDIPPNPSELLGSEQMKVTIDVLKNEFDYILIDLPPVTAVSDPLVVSKLLNGMLVVVRANHTSRRVLDETVRKVQFADVKILGFVITRSDTQTKNYKRYGKYYKYQ